MIPGRHSVGGGWACCWRLRHARPAHLSDREPRRRARGRSPASRSPAQPIRLSSGATCSIVQGRVVDRRRGGHGLLRGRAAPIRASRPLRGEGGTPWISRCSSRRRTPAARRCCFRVYGVDRARRPGRSRSAGRSASSSAAPPPGGSRVPQPGGPRVRAARRPAWSCSAPTPRARPTCSRPSTTRCCSAPSAARRTRRWRGSAGPDSTSRPSSRAARRTRSGATYAGAGRRKRIAGRRAGARAGGRRGGRLAGGLVPARRRRAWPPGPRPARRGLSRPAAVAGRPRLPAGAGPLPRRAGPAEQRAPAGPFRAGARVRRAAGRARARTWCGRASGGRWAPPSSSRPSSSAWARARTRGSGTAAATDLAEPRRVGPRRWPRPSPATRPAA